MSSKGLVLVTGVNGFIAARTAEALLAAGFEVRGTVRAQASAKGLRAALAAYGERLQIVEVPDMTAAGAFDAAVAGVDAIAHLASPVSMFFKDPAPVIRAAVEGTTAVLESAARSASVRSVVLMSSIVAVLTAPTDEPRVLTEADWNDWAEGIAAARGSDTPGPVIYSASKAAAEKAFWRFRDERKPAFTMTAINPW